MMLSILSRHNVAPFWFLFAIYSPCVLIIQPVTGATVAEPVESSSFSHWNSSYWSSFFVSSSDSSTGVAAASFSAEEESQDKADAASKSTRLKDSLPENLNNNSDDQDNQDKYQICLEKVAVLEDLVRDLVNHTCQTSPHLADNLEGLSYSVLLERLKLVVAKIAEKTSLAAAAASSGLGLISYTTAKVDPVDEDHDPPVVIRSEEQQQVPSLSQGFIQIHINWNKFYQWEEKGLRRFREMRESAARLFDEMQQKWDIFVCFLKQQLRDWLQNFAKCQSKWWTRFRVQVGQFLERGHQIQHKVRDHMRALGNYLASLDVVPILPWLAVMIVCLGFGAGAMIYFLRRNRTSTDLVLYQVDSEQVDEPDGADAGLSVDALTLERTSDRLTEESSSSSGANENAMVAAAAALTPLMKAPAKTQTSDDADAGIETRAVLISPEQKKPDEPALSPPPLELVFGLNCSTSLPRRQVSSNGAQENAVAAPTAGSDNAVAATAVPVGVSPFRDGATNNRDDIATGGRIFTPTFKRMENPYAKKTKSRGKISGSSANPVWSTQNQSDAAKKQSPALGVFAPQASTNASSKTLNDAPMADADMVVPEDRAEKADTTINCDSSSLKRKRDSETPKPTVESENGANDCQANKKRKIAASSPVDTEQD